MQNDQITRAVEIAGGQTALARLCGKKQGHVSFWLKSEKVSAEVAILIHAATGGAVPKEELRPDLFAPRPQHRLKTHQQNPPLTVSPPPSP